jgi:hypothetical protein
VSTPEEREAKWRGVEPGQTWHLAYDVFDVVVLILSKEETWVTALVLHERDVGLPELAPGDPGDQVSIGNTFLIADGARRIV